MDYVLMSPPDRGGGDIFIKLSAIRLEIQTGVSCSVFCYGSTPSGMELSRGVTAAILY